MSGRVRACMRVCPSCLCALKGRSGALTLSVYVHGRALQMCDIGCCVVLKNIGCCVKSEIVKLKSWFV